VRGHEPSRQLRQRLPHNPERDPDAGHRQPLARRGRSAFAISHTVPGTRARSWIGRKHRGAVVGTVPSGAGSATAPHPYFWPAGSPKECQRSTSMTALMQRSSRLG
jgi:hypothetical protein